MAILQLWPILFFFALGYLLQRSGKVPVNLPHQLNLVAIRVVFPALILATVPFLTLDLSATFAVAAAWGCIALAIPVSLLVSSWLGLDSKARCALLILTSLGNTGFLGVPMLKSLAGNEPLAYAILFDQFGTFVAVSTYGVILVAVHSGEKVRGLQLVKDIVLFPPLIALIAAIFLPSGWWQPPRDFLQLLAKLVVPLTMLSIGMKFRFRLAPGLIGPVSAALGIKMLLLPLGVWLAATLSAMPPAILQASLFQAATPPMVTGAALLMSRNIAPDLTAAILGFGTLAAFIWLPLIASLT